MSRSLFGGGSEAVTEHGIKRQNGNPEGVALDSRAATTVDAGCASSWGWGETGGQGDLPLGLKLCNSGHLLFSR